MKLPIFVTYLTVALYVHPLWFYKHQHDNRVRSKLSVACQRWWFEWRFWFVPSVPGYTLTLSLETVHTAFEWNYQMVVVSLNFVRNWRWTIVPRQPFWLLTIYLDRWGDCNRAYTAANHTVATHGQNNQLFLSAACEFPTTHCSQPRDTKC